MCALRVDLPCAFTRMVMKLPRRGVQANGAADSSLQAVVVIQRSMLGKTVLALDLANTRVRAKLPEAACGLAVQRIREAYMTRPTSMSMRPI